MNRVRLFSAATLVAVGVSVPAVLLGQGAPASSVPVPDLHPVLAGRTLTPPFRGEAQVQIVWPIVPRRDKNMVVTKIQVKNISSGPLVRFTIEQPWYDKGGGVSASAKAVVNGLLQPDEVQTVTIELPYKDTMLSNNYLFSHQNGTVKPVKVAKMEAPAAAGKPAPPKK